MRDGLIGLSTKGYLLKSKTPHRFSTAVCDWENFLGRRGKRIHEAGDDDVVAWRTEMTSGFKQAMVKDRMKVIKDFYEYLLKVTIIERNPF